MAGAHDLGEAGDADARHLTLLPPSFDVFAQIVVAQLLEGHVHGLRVVTAVVDPASRDVYGKLFGWMKLFMRNSAWSRPSSIAALVTRAFDEIARLRDSERAPVRNAARPLLV